MMKRFGHSSSKSGWCNERHFSSTDIDATHALVESGTLGKVVVDFLSSANLPIP